MKVKCAVIDLKISYLQQWTCFSLSWLESIFSFSLSYLMFWTVMSCFGLSWHLLLAQIGCSDP